MKKAKKPKRRKKVVPARIQELRYNRGLLAGRLYRLRKAIMGAEDEELPAIKKKLNSTAKKLKGVRHRLGVYRFGNAKKGKAIKSERQSLYAKRLRLIKIRDKKVRGRKKRISKAERARLNSAIAKLSVRISILNRRLQLKKKPKKKKERKVRSVGQWLEQIMPFWDGDEELRYALKRNIFKIYVINGKKILKKAISDIKYYFGKFIDECAARVRERKYNIIVSKSYKKKTILFDFYGDEDSLEIARARQERHS